MRRTQVFVPGDLIDGQNLVRPRFAFEKLGQQKKSDTPSHIQLRIRDTLIRNRETL